MLKGIYTLLITLNTPTIISVGKLGEISFSEGYYVYVGSALNGLEARLARHFKENKVRHWHVDYFLKEASISKVIYSITATEKECDIASQLTMSLTSIPRFGCSDCSCKSHLFYCKDLCQIRKIVMTSFGKCVLVPRIWG